MAKEKSDDLFETGTMTFGEHLEELRSTLLKCLYWLAGGVIVGIYFANQAVILIQTPLTNALEEYYRTSAEQKFEDANDDSIPPEAETMLNRNNLVPDENVQVNAAVLFSELRDLYPDECSLLPNISHLCTVKDVPLKAVIPASKILVANIEKPLAIAKPTEPTAQESLIVARHAIWNVLDESQQQEITTISKKNQATAKDQVTLVKCFNSVIRKGRLYKIPTGKEISQAERDKALDPLKLGTFITRKNWSVTVLKLQKELQVQFEENSSRRFNRLLLSSSLVKIVPTLTEIDFQPYLDPPSVSLVSLPTWKPAEVQVKSLKAEESFMIWLKAAIVVGFLIASPGIFWHVWNFVSAGLYVNERKFVWIYLPFSLLLFFAGAALAFNFVFEPVLRFLFSFNQAMNIDPDPRISEWLGFVLFLPIGFGISFQLPLVMLLLNRLSIFSVRQYLEKWRIAILVICVLSMLLTPADPVSMLLMAVPLTVLYFLGVALCQWMPRNKSPFGEVEET